MKKRWRLHALPLRPDRPEELTDYGREVVAFSKRLADTYNERAERFWTRRGAASAARFYTTRVYLPVDYIVIDEKEAGYGAR